MPGETILGQYQFCPGGKGANQAVAAALSGASVVMVGAVGNDAQGRDLKMFLQDKGVNILAVQDVDVPTGVALIAVDKNAENSIIVCPGANLQARLTDKSIVEKEDVFLCQGETSYDHLLNALDMAKQKGARTVLNPAPYFDLQPELLKYLDIMIFNEIEFQQFTGHDSSKKMTDILSNVAFPGDLIVTLGADGALVRSSGRIQKVIAPSVHPVDTTGAGDCFCGNFAGRLTFGDNLFAAADYACKAASISVTHLGAANSMPCSDEIKKAFKA